MNKKILLIATLVIMTIISIGCVSASEDMANDNSLSDSGDALTVSESVDAEDTSAPADEPVLTEDGPTVEPTTIEINNTMSNEEIQAKLNTITNNTIVNFAPGEYNDVNLLITTPDDSRLGNVKINGNGATLIGTPAWSTDPNKPAYFTGIFEVQKIDGFTLSGFNFVALGVNKANVLTPSCVIIYNTTNGIIENNNISGGRFGLYVGSKFNAPNRNTIIRFNTVTNVSDMGIISFGSPGSKILNNTVINPANHGIDVRHVTGNGSLVQGNKVIGAKEGIYLMHSGGHTAIENQLINCSIGITCYGSKHINIDYNTFTNTKIRILLSSGYGNITVGENNNYGVTNVTSGMEVPMPPTFAYYIVKGDGEYVLKTSGTFSDGDSSKVLNSTRIQVHYLTEEGDNVEIEDGSITQIPSDTFGLNNVTIKIWKNSDSNHIDAGEAIKVFIDGVDYSGTSDDTGAVYIDASDLGDGKHYISIKYAGNANLEGCSWSTLLVTGDGLRKATTIEYSDMTTDAFDYKIEGRIGKNFTVTLKDNEGKILKNKDIQIGFNGVIYNKKTDDNGKASLQINLGNKGTYTFAICYLGDDNYGASFAVAKITVNTQKPSLTAPNKSYKANAKTKSITAILKSANGSLIANKKVTFTINGKTYSAKTNAKGVATVNVSLNQKGTYSFTAKFAGDNTYSAVSKTGKLTLK